MQITIFIGIGILVLFQITDLYKIYKGNKIEKYFFNKIKYDEVINRFIVKAK